EQCLTLHHPGGGLPSAPVERQAPVQGGQPPRLRRGDLAVPGRRLHARLGDRGSGVPDVSRAGREARAPAASVGSPLIRAHHGKERRVMKRSRVVTALAVAVLVAARLSPGEPYEAVTVSEGGTITGTVIFQGGAQATPHVWEARELDRGGQRRRDAGSAPDAADQEVQTSLGGWGRRRLEAGLSARRRQPRRRDRGLRQQVADQGGPTGGEARGR